MMMKSTFTLLTLIAAAKTALAGVTIPLSKSNTAAKVTVDGVVNLDALDNAVEYTKQKYYATVSNFQNKHNGKPPLGFADASNILTPSKHPKRSVAASGFEAMNYYYGRKQYCSPIKAPY